MQRDAASTGPAWQRLAAALALMGGASSCDAKVEDAPDGEAKAKATSPAKASAEAPENADLVDVPATHDAAAAMPEGGCAPGGCAPGACAGAPKAEGDVKADAEAHAPPDEAARAQIDEDDKT